MATYPRYRKDFNMNVCLLNDSFPPVIDGVANVVMNYGEIMTKELGAEVLVATPRYPKADYDHYPYKVVPYPSLDTTGFIAGYRTGNPLAMREIKQIESFKPDIIHSHCPASSTVMARLLQGTGAPLVFTYHTKFDVDIARAVGEGFLKAETIKAMVSNISACDEVWAVSEGAAENLRNLGYRGDIITMRNGVDFPRGKVSQEDILRVTKDYDLPEGVPMFLFVGRMMKYKGLPLIIDAMKMLSDTGVDYRCVFIGGGADAEEMHQKVRDLGIKLYITGEDGKTTKMGEGNGSGAIIFTGAIHDREILRAWNSRADLFLFPSVYDTNGLVVREAAACGLASVLVKGSCAAEGVTHTRNAYLIEESAESMAVLLADACGDLECVRQMGQNAMDELYLSWEDAVRNAYSRYEQLREMRENGELKPREPHVSDRVLEAAGDIAEAAVKVFDIPKVIYGNMKESMENLRADVKEGVDDLKDRVQDGMEEIRDNVKSGVDNLKADVKGSMDSVRLGFDEGFKNGFRGGFHRLFDSEQARDNAKESIPVLMEKADKDAE